MTNQIDPRRIEYLALADIEPDSRNPKAHDVDTIDESVGRFGVLDLIVRDERTGKIVSGHGRHKVLNAMQARGEEPPEGIKTDDAGDWLVPVVTGWASRTDSEAAAALIALNRTTELGGWVDDSLLELLDELGDIDDGLVGVGFDANSLDELHESLEVPDFQPDESGAVQLAQKSITTCPNCGHDFEPVTRTVREEDDEDTDDTTPDFSDTPLDEVAATLIEALSPDLLKKEWRDQEDRKPLAGYCYVVSETLYHTWGKQNGYQPTQIEWEGVSHWYLSDMTGDVIDLTSSQFDTTPDYPLGKRRGFLTKEPSKRSQTLISRLEPARVDA